MNFDFIVVMKESTYVQESIPQFIANIMVQNSSPYLTPFVVR